MACSIGTSGAVRISADHPRVDDRGRVFCYVLAPGRYVIGGAVNNGGIALDWIGDTVAPDLRSKGPTALLELAEQVPAGCGGLRIGGARFSPKHANFVENMGDATTADVIALMAEGRRRVKEGFGIELEPEVQGLGPIAFPSDWKRR